MYLISKIAGSVTTTTTTWLPGAAVFKAERFAEIGYFCHLSGWLSVLLSISEEARKCGDGQEFGTRAKELNTCI